MGGFSEPFTLARSTELLVAGRVRLLLAAAAARRAVDLHLQFQAPLSPSRSVVVCRDGQSVEALAFGTMAAMSTHEELLLDHRRPTV